MIPKPDQCPYCKIDFRNNSWAGQDWPRIICKNCRNYYLANEARRKEKEEIENSKKK